MTAQNALLRGTGDIDRQYIKPLRQKMNETNDATQLYEMRQALASYILLAEKGCTLLTNEDECLSVSGGHCTWIPDKAGFLMKAFRLFGRGSPQCIGTTLHSLQISMPPTPADLKRISKRFDYLLDKNEQHELIGHEQQELMILQALRGELEADTTQLDEYKSLLDINTEKSESIQKMIKQCRSNMNCPHSRLRQLEDKLLHCQEERERLVGGLKAALRRMGPYILAFVIMGSLAGVAVSTGAFATAVQSMSAAATAVWNSAFATQVMTFVGVAKQIKQEDTGLAKWWKSDPALKKIIHKYDAKKTDLSWPLPRYKWRWRPIATKLYGLAGTETGILTTDVKRLFPGTNAVVVDEHGYESIHWLNLMKHLRKFKLSNRTAPKWTRVKKEVRQ